MAARNAANLSLTSQNVSELHIGIATRLEALDVRENGEACETAGVRDKRGRFETAGTAVRSVRLSETATA